MAATSSTASGATASSVAVRRLQHDLVSLQRSQNPQIAVRPSEANLLEWHFVLHSFPADTPYCGGCYHGKIIFPPEYPHAPPAILMVTPSGRLETKRRLCLSMTDFHPESWNPAWSVETILVGLLSFFISDVEMGYGAVVAPPERRRHLAVESWATNAADADFRLLFPEFLERPADIPSSGSQLPDDPAPEVASEVPADLPSQVEILDGRIADVQAKLLHEAATNSLLRQELEGLMRTRAAVLPMDQAPARATAPLGSALPPEPASGGERRTSHEGTSNTGSAVVPLGDADAGEGNDHDEESDEDSPMECWICRDMSSDEPLIQPCACRGSMSGVHASCVEQWIRHHRRNAVNDEVPRCSVCHQQYTGYEQRPGVTDFFRHVCRDVAMQLFRTLVLVLLLVGFQAASDPTVGIPLGLRILFVLVFSVVAFHRLLMLTVSLPPHQPPPQNTFLLRFFVGDPRGLAMHIAEVFAAVSILGIWCVSGTLPILYFAPFGLAVLIPVGKVLCARHPSLMCVMHFFMFLASLLLLPPFIIAMLCRLAWRNPRRVLHPLNAGPHVAVAIAAIPLCLCLASNVAVIVVWVVHSALVGLGLVEILLVKRLRWKEGTSWWFALQLTALAAYVANAFCEFPEGFPDKQKTGAAVLLASCVWLCLVSSLSVIVNWSLLVQHFRTWQHRHGTFTLRVPGRDQPGVSATNGQAAVTV